MSKLTYYCIWLKYNLTSLLLSNAGNTKCDKTLRSLLLQIIPRVLRQVQCLWNSSRCFSLFSWGKNCMSSFPNNSLFYFLAMSFFSPFIYVSFGGHPLLYELKEIIITHIEDDLISSHFLCGYIIHYVT